MSELEGWIKLHRELLEKPIWEGSTPEQKVILITLLTMANHKEKEWEFKGEKYKALPGQFVTSLDSIVKKAGSGISIKNVRTALQRFEKFGFLANQSTNKNRLITIVNWEVYQGSNDVGGKQDGKQLASEGQATGKQPATNKNERTKELNLSTTTTTDDVTKLINIFNQNICPLSPFQMESLEDWYKDFKNNFEILMEAIKICADRNKKSFGFFEYLLRDWANNNITSFEQVQSYERNKFGKPNKLQVVPSPEKKKDKPEYNYGF